MQNPENMQNISVVWREKSFTIEMNSCATIKELGLELQKLTNVKADTMRLIVPQSSNKSSKLLSPFSDEHAFLSLQETSIRKVPEFTFILFWLKKFTHCEGKFSWYIIICLKSVVNYWQQALLLHCFIFYFL
jgi:hypothetical protein